MLDQAQARQILIISGAKPKPNLDPPHPTNRSNFSRAWGCTRKSTKLQNQYELIFSCPILVPLH